MGKKIDLTGQTFGRLTVIEEAGRDRHKNVLWRCTCRCGNETYKSTARLRGGVQSCGCVHLERITKHGMHETRFYEVWENMKQRTSNPNNKDYKEYGGRGIILCPRWRKFENFRDDMYKFYLKHAEEHGEEDTTIERVGNNTRYAPHNCRFATWEEQARNRRPRKTKSEPTAAKQSDSEITYDTPILDDSHTDVKEDDKVG